jgi:hypothetical protein
LPQFYFGALVQRDRNIKRSPRDHDVSVNIDSPFMRDANDKLVRRSYWLDMNDKTLVMVMTKGIGANLTNDEKRAHLADLRREHLIDQVCMKTGHSALECTSDQSAPKLVGHILRNGTF